MSSCELCGKESGSLTKVKIEGAKLSVCDSCSDLGTELKSSKKKKRKKNKSGRSTGGRSQKVLAPDYGKRIKEAREEEGISIKEIADELNEKTSLISKIEKEQLKPDKALAGKLSNRFDITLYTNPEVTDYNDTGGTDDRKATMRDVANVKDD